MHVIPQLSGRAGAEVSLRDLVLATQGTSLDHAITVLRPSPNDFTAIDELGVPRFVPGSILRSRPAMIRHVRRAIAAFEPELVHTSLFDADLAGRLAARRAGLASLTSVVNTPYAATAASAEPVSAIKRRGVLMVDRVLARHATTAFHAISSAAADEAATVFGVSRDSIAVVPRGRSAAALGRPTRHRRILARRQLGIGTDRPVIVNVARQEPQKGQRHLLDALPTVRKRHPGLVTLMVGREGRSSADLRERAHQLGVDDTLRWLGVRSDVPELLAAADVFAFPSLYEGLGGAVLEAMALRVPVVASNIPALREVLDDGRAGTLVPPANGQVLADAIDRGLTRGPAVAAALEAAERRFHEHYELATVAERMRCVYDWALSQADR